MAPPSDWIQEFGSALAAARQAGTLADLRLDRVMTRDAAEAVQSAASESYGGSAVGYAIRATDVLSRRRMNCDTPIFGRLLDTDLVLSGARFRLPHGVLGAGCCFIFAMGRPFPVAGEVIDRRSTSEALADCRIAIEVVGRRVRGSVPLNALTATSDFALNVVVCEGAHVRNFANLDLAAAQVAAKINGNVVSTGRGGDVMGDPVEAVAWLARELRGRGQVLEAGELIATGTCVGILQVMPGQTFEADFGPLGSVELQLE